MNRIEIHKKIHLYLSCGISFLLSFKFLIPALTALLFINWLAEGNFKTKLLGVKNKFVFFLFISLYLLYVLGMLYTSDLNYGWADLLSKISILIFTFLFATRNFNENDFKKIIVSFVSGLLLASLVLLIRASYFYFSARLNYFFYIDFSFFLHPSYFGMYVNLALLFVLRNPHSSELPKYSKLILSLFLTLIIVLLSSKLALISTLLIFSFHGLNYIVTARKYKMGILLTGAFFAAIIVLLNSVPELDARIQNAVDAINSDKIDKTNSESNAVRILVWNAATNALVENGMFGVGTGDAKEELFRHYKKSGYTGALEHHLNAHNQFLQTGVTLGFIGLLVLIATFLFSILSAWKEHNFLFVSFALLLIINYLTESMLEAEAGVLFIAFFQSLLFFRSDKEILNFVTKKDDSIFTTPH